MNILYFNEEKTKGKYVYADGNIYTGGFQNGKFHGEGVMTYKGKGEYRGEWKEGKMVKGEYFFEDGLKYEKNWKYLIEDSFYFNEKINNNEVIYSEPPKNLYFSNTFDVGDGFYKGEDNIIYDFKKKEEVRKICHREQKWIENHCANY